jgi:adenine-specific DNA-methyltransferase
LTESIDDEPTETTDGGGDEQSEQASEATATAPQSTNVLDDALRRLEALDPALAQTLRREVEALRDGRSFGLVFERHLPESVRLTEHPIKRGVQVALRAPEKNEENHTWRVVAVSGRGSERTARLDDETEHRVTDLVVVRDFGEPIYPGLKPVKRIAKGPKDAPWHVVVNGENFHVLQALRMTHREKVDLVYIDPPYNTGNKGWIYNDRYIAEKDSYKHSKWLSFIERRINLAYDLLKDTGVIFVAIGDDEHHRLRMLMDQVFGQENFISNIVWQGGRKNDSRHVSNGADYMLVYAKKLSTWTVKEYNVKDAPNVGGLLASEISEKGARWRVTRPGQDAMVAAGVKCWEESGHDSETATKLMKKWIKSLPAGHPAKKNNRFYEFEPDGRVFRKRDISWPGGGGERYDVLHPKTGLPVQVPGSGWRYSEEIMAELIANDRVLFGPDDTYYINQKLYLDEADSMAAESVFFQKRTSAGTRLRGILGDNRFPNPKDDTVIQRWIGLAAPKDAVILDFFGGSGTTTEAVIRQNAADGGIRQSILVTNNELSAKDAAALTKAGHRAGDPEWEAQGVFSHVTVPRVSTIVTGKRPDGTTYSEGLAANVKFFDLTYLDDTRVHRAREFEAIAPLLWLWGGARGDYPNEEPVDGYAIEASFCLLTDVDFAGPFLTDLGALEEPPLLAFIVTDSPSDFEAISSRLPRACRPIRLYELYLRNFEINAGELP